MRQYDTSKDHDALKGAIYEFFGLEADLFFEFASITSNSICLNRLGARSMLIVPETDEHGETFLRVVFMDGDDEEKECAQP